MANRGRHRKRHVKHILHMSKYHESWISNVLDDPTIDRILYYQFVQCGIRDLTRFEKNPWSGSPQGGFTWEKTTEGHSFWEKIMCKIDFYKNTAIHERS